MTNSNEHLLLRTEQKNKPTLDLVVKPWMNKEGSLKTDHEIERDGKNWDYDTWDSYFKTFESAQVETQPLSLSMITSLSDKDFTKIFLSYSEDGSSPFLKAAVKLCVDKLSKRERSIITMTFWERKTQHQIANELNIARTSVQVYLIRAQTKIKSYVVSNKVRVITSYIKKHYNVDLDSIQHRNKETA